MLEVITWNLDGNPRTASKVPNTLTRIGNALQLLKAQFSNPETIIILQEIADDSAFRARVNSSLSSHYSMCMTVAKHHAMVLYGSAFEEVASEVISTPFAIGADSRAVRVLLKRKSDNRLVKIYGLHLPDRLNYGERSRMRAAELYGRQIRLDWGNSKNTIVGGDFNDNPYDLNICSRTSFFAIREAVLNFRRLIGIDKFPPLYNPSWSVLPDRSPRANGTYFFKNPGADAIHWNLFDQFLVGFDLAAKSKVEIVDTLATHSLLLANNTPDPSFSDHLPFSIKIDW